MGWKKSCNLYTNTWFIYRLMQKKKKRTHRREYLISLLFKYIHYFHFDVSPQIQCNSTEIDFYCSFPYLFCPWHHNLRFSLENIHAFSLLGKSCLKPSPFIHDGSDNTMVTGTQNPKNVVQLQTQNAAQHETFPHQRFCQVPRSNLVTSCLGYSDSLCDHTPSNLCI